MSFVGSLEPQALWRHFDHLLTIPRPSGAEQGARQYVLEVAKRLGRDARQDAVGNVVVTKPASPGRDGAPTVILQSHLDMVEEKRAGTTHDFTRDPLRPRRDGDYLYATDTTLGADNGIGLAAMLAVLEANTLEHPALELLFTVDEERGLAGAGGLDGRLLSGRRLLNLDSEEEGIFYIGCSGGGDSELTLPARRDPVPSGSNALRCVVGGLRGGHSGADIHLQRGNAIQLLVRVLRAAEAVTPLRIAGIEGGGARNAVPRDAEAVIVVPTRQVDAVTKALNAEFGRARQELRKQDPDGTLAITATSLPAAAWAADLAATVMRLLLALPHGVMAMSMDLPGLVETSGNVAMIHEQDDRIVIGTSQRSSVASALTALRARVKAIAELAGAMVEQPPAYPGWQPNPASPLLAMVQDIYTARTGHAAEVKAIHAGLECGLIGERVPGVDMVSLGPLIEHAHSPDERVHIPSVGRFYDLLCATLRALAAAT
jgi:dipeptidase D